MDKVNNNKEAKSKQMKWSEIQDTLYNRLLEFLTTAAARQVAYTLEGSGFGTDCKIYKDSTVNQIIIEYSTDKFKVELPVINLFGMANLVRID